MQKFKNWITRHIETREQGSHFVEDYEQKPALRKRWLRVDIIGLVILLIALAILMSGILDAEPFTESTPTPADTNTPAPLPIGKAGEDASLNLSMATFWQRPAAHRVG
jgi:hypothetical protein